VKNSDTGFSAVGLKMRGLDRPCARADRHRAQARTPPSSKAIRESACPCSTGVRRRLALPSLELGGLHNYRVDASNCSSQSQEAGGGSFVEASYADLVRRPGMLKGPFGLVVANYSLLGETIGPLLGNGAFVAGQRRSLIIQTLHPLSQDPDTRDEAGWRTEPSLRQVDGFNARMPYYFPHVQPLGRELTAAKFAIVHCRSRPTPKPESLYPC